MHRGFRFDLHPTPAQAETLDQWVGVTRLVYNLALEQRRDFWRQYRATEGRSISFPSQCRELTELRAAFDFIAAPPRTCLEQALRDLDRAYAGFFSGRGGRPEWRKWGQHDTIRCKAEEVRVHKISAKWSELCFPKLGWLRFRSTRPILGELRNVTLRRNGEGWSVSFAADIGEAPATNDLPSAGIDVGVANTLSLSTGEHKALPGLGTLHQRVRRAQRIMSRRKRGSRRYAKQRSRMAAIKSRIARIRRHWAHETTTDIARRFGVVALEDLNIKSMTASAAGTADAPGRSVAQKRGLNRSILNQAWGQIGSMLEYKLEAAGGRLIYVPAAYTSQTCSACGVVDRQSRKSQARFVCVHCGHEAHADTNAAIEIRRRSTALLLVEGGHLGSPDEARTWAVCPLEPAIAGGADPDGTGNRAAFSSAPAR